MGNHKQGQDRERERYQQLFGLPAEQIRFFHELTDEQVQEVRYYFTAGLVDVDNWMYAVKCDGHLVSSRERRRPEWKADW